MDNPLAGSSDSEDSDGSGGMFDFTDSEDASSDDGGEPEPWRIVTSPMDSLAPETCRSETLGSDCTSHAINER